METYMLIMYVTHEQESSIQSLFTDKHWIFCKADSDKLMSPRKIICRFDSLDDAVPTIYTESKLDYKHTTLYGDLHADIPKLINNRNVVTDTNTQKIKLSFDFSVPDAEFALKVPDVKLKECFVSLKRISTAYAQYVEPETSQPVGKKRGITKESNISNMTNLTSVKKSRRDVAHTANTLGYKKENKDVAVSKSKVEVKKRQDIDDMIPKAEEVVMMRKKRDDQPTSNNIDRSCENDTVNETNTSKIADHSETGHKSVNDGDEMVIRDLDYGDSDTQISQTDVDSNDEVCDITEINKTENDDSDFCDHVGNYKTIKDLDNGLKKTKKQIYRCETCNKTYKFEMSYRKHKEKNCGVVKIKMG